MKTLSALLLGLIVFLPCTMTQAADTRETLANSLPANADDAHIRAKLIDLWTNAARKPSGDDNDEIKIRTITLPENLRIVTVRWLSVDAAVAQCEVGKTRYLAFFYRENGKWAFPRHYSLGQGKS